LPRAGRRSTRAAGWLSGAGRRGRCIVTAGTGRGRAAAGRWAGNRLLAGRAGLRARPGGCRFAASAVVEARQAAVARRRVHAGRCGRTGVARRLRRLRERGRRLLRWRRSGAGCRLGRSAHGLAGAAVVPGTRTGHRVADRTRPGCRSADVVRPGPWAAELVRLGCRSADRTRARRRPAGGPRTRRWVAGRT
jgi:hypothetical protein